MERGVAEAVRAVAAVFGGARAVAVAGAPDGGVVGRVPALATPSSHPPDVMVCVDEVHTTFAPMRKVTYSTPGDTARRAWAAASRILAPALPAVVIESPVAAMESGRPFVRAPLGPAVSATDDRTSMTGPSAPAGGGSRHGRCSLHPCRSEFIPTLRGVGLKPDLQASAVGPNLFRLSEVSG